MAFFSPTLFLVALRESLEAFLIMSILAGLVVKLGRPTARKYLLYGAGAALVLTLIGGFLATEAIAQFVESQGIEALFAGSAAIVAVAILTYMVFWMYRQTITMVGPMKQRAAAALDAGRPIVLATIAFVAVAREGLETVLLVPSAIHESSGLGLLTSAMIGLAVSAVLAYLIFAGVVQLSIERFFAVSGFILIFFAAGLLGTAMHEFTGDWAAAHGFTAWNTTALLDDSSGIGHILEATVGYHAEPSWFDVAVYLGYLVGLGYWFLHTVARHPARKPHS